MITIELTVVFDQLPKLSDPEQEKLVEALQRQLPYHVAQIASTVRRDPQPGADGDVVMPFIPSLGIHTAFHAQVVPDVF